MIHVPLLVRLPERFGRRPARFDGIVELRDLVPTLCHTLGRPCGVGTGRSLLRRLRARTPRPAVARAWTSDANTFVLGAVVTGERKLVLDMKARRAALYDLVADPAEQRDLARSEPARVRRLVRRLRAPRGGLAGSSRTSAPDDAAARKLRALGYVE
jgi:arylsulfatase A-like enzyme